jgi:hypothetical protein
MEDFKLGDEVRVLEKATHGDVRVGTVGIITFVDDNEEVRVGNNGYNWFLGESGGKLELVKPERQHQHEGLTKREAFAMTAIQGLLSNSNMGDIHAWETPQEWVKQMTEASVALADALLKELSK